MLLPGVLLVLSLKNLPWNCTQYWIIFDLFLLGDAQPRTRNWLWRSWNSSHLCSTKSSSKWPKKKYIWKILLNVVIYLINFCYNYFCPQFYFYILAVSSALLCIYILCNLYNLIWIVCPQLGTMYRLICRYQEHMVLGTPITTSNNATNSHNSNIVKLRTLSCDEDITVPLTGVKVVSVKNYYLNSSIFMSSIRWIKR